MTSKQTSSTSHWGEQLHRSARLEEENFRLQKKNILMREFLSKCVNLAGPYPYLNGKTIVSDIYKLIEEVDQH